MRMFDTKKKRIVVAAAAAATMALGGGLAYAYWTSTGIGTGTATTGTSAKFVIASEKPVGGPLSPGGPEETVDFTVTNPGPGSLNLSSVVITIANDDGSPWTSVKGCSDLDYTVKSSINYGEILPGDVVTGQVTIIMNNLKSNQDGCKLADVPLYIVAS